MCGIRYHDVSLPGSRAPSAMLRTAMNIPAKNAVQNPEILKPGTTADTSSNISALITRRNRPRVITVNGSVRTIRMGLITALTKPRSSAETISDDVLAKRMPPNTWLAIQSVSAERAHCRRKGIKLSSMVWSLALRLFG